MGYKYAVLGAGRQGTACAYDMIKLGEAESVLLADKSLAAAEAFEAARAAGMTGPAVEYNAGVSYYRSGNYSRAEDSFRDLARSYPQMTPLAEYNLGLALLKQERFDEARAALDKAVELAPDAVAPRLIRAETAIQQERYEAAEDDLNKLLLAQPGLVQALLLRSPIVPWSYFASNFYHNVYWYPVVGRKRVEAALQTPWGQLFERYGADAGLEGAVLPTVEAKTLAQGLGALAGAAALTCGGLSLLRSLSSRH